MRHLVSKLTALLLLCLYGWSCTSLSSFAFATLAEISGEHEVRVQWTESGVRVVLCHQQATQPTIQVSDHRRPLTRALSSLCLLNGHGDHVFTRATEFYTEAKTTTTARSGPSAKALSFNEGPVITAWALRPAMALPTDVRWRVRSKADRCARPQASLGTMALLV